MSSASQLKVTIYQIPQDEVFKANRTDGTGWEWRWADWRRQWMDNTPNAFAYRCLPLTIANQVGWQILNPVGFTAFWRGRNEPGNIDFTFDSAGELWKGWINDQFGQGIITWNTPFLIRTEPAGSRLLVTGPPNYFKRHAHPLTAVVETDWMSMSFTMNWKLMEACEPVRFEAGEPLLQIIPLAGNIGADLENAEVRYQRLSDDPAVHKAYTEWHQSRRMFHELKREGQVKANDWQKDYFRGQDVSGQQAAPQHATKLKPPEVKGGKWMRGK
jgi:hypothetical protein